MSISLKKINIAHSLLEKYDGINPYIKGLKYGVFVKKDKTLNDLEIEYIIRNNDYKPEKYNKVVKIAKWYAEQQKEKWGITFLPLKVLITDILGETDNIFHVYLKYKQNMDKPIMCFIPKKALLDDLKAKDYNDLDVNFKPFNDILAKENKKLYEHQESAVKFLLSRKKALLADDQGLGKSLIISTLVYTKDGSKKIGDIKIGDRVIGSDGKSHNVTGVFPQGIKELYKVTFNDGFSIKCCKEHLWTVLPTSGSNRGPGKELDNRRNRFLTLSTEQMLDKNLTLKQNGIGYNSSKEYSFSAYYKDKSERPKWQIPIVKPIEFEVNNKLPIEPYLLGLSIGDGCISKNRIIFEVHKDDFDELFDKINISEKFIKNLGNKRRCVINNVGDSLLQLGLLNKHAWDKFIPDIYKFSSIENRIALLQGLMDTDGYCMKSKKNNTFSATEYSTVSEQLANDVAELVQCLGGIVRIHTKIGSYKKDGIKHECRKVYRLNIKMPDGINPFRLKRKAELYNPPKKYKVGRYIKNIEPCGSEEAVCISIDSPDKLYVAEHAIVTHNTTSSVVASIAGNFKKVLIICPASLKSNWKKELIRFVPEYEVGIVNSNNWVDKKYTIINYDILNMHYVVPTETIIEERVSRDKWGNVKEDKDGNPIIKRIEKKIKSRKKEIKEAAKLASNLYLANFDLVIIDECHKLSDNKSIRYEVIDDFLTRTGIENVYLMSGTPMTNKPINLFHVLSLINHPVCENYEYFVQNYCDGKQITNNYTQRKMWLTGGASNLDELMERIKTSYLRRLKKDIPGMVQKEIHQRYYELTDEQRFEYDNLWDEYEKSQLEIDNEKEFTKQLTEGIFLRQFVSNAMIPNTIELANEFIEDGKKVFIACCFDDEITKLKEYYGDRAVIYKGGMTAKQKDESERKFMTDDKTMVFIGNIIAAGVGLTLTSSHICIFNSYDWVPSNNWQMMDRVHRIGQRYDVEVYYQLFSDTISEDMWNKIIVKTLNIESVIKEETNK